MSNNGDVLNGSTRTGTTDELSLGPTHKQTVTLAGREPAYTIHGFEVDIHSSIASTEGPIDAGSSKVKISTITNQNWELPSHSGTIVASNSQYLVYVLEGRNGHVLRLIQQETNNRALLKGFVGAVLDVSFAHSNSNLLACVDQGGNVYIWDLDKTQDVSKIQSDALKVEVHRGSCVDSLQHRLVWSPYVPQEEDEDESDSCCLVVTHGSDVEVFDVHVVFRNVISGMRMPREKLREGILVFANAHERTVSDISLSPDGAVLATASEDGHLKFWQVNWELKSEEKPKCLHDFEPHRGAPVSRLIFCDNHLSQDPTAEFWRFLITAANHNTEVKIWCAVTWKCLQTLHFCPPHDNLDKLQPHILLRLDLSASYLLATDAKRMALYVLQFFQDASLGDASVTSITEYILTQPILSFVVSGHTPLAQSQSDIDSGEEGEEVASPSGAKDFDSRRNVALVKLHCIQSRSMQELLVKFEPPDIFGIPGVGEDLHQDLMGSFSEPMPKHLSSYDSPLVPPDSSLGFDPSPLHLPPSTTSQFSSLPTDVFNNTYHNEVITPPATTLFHSLTSTSNTVPVGSPKLLTPSEFSSPAKARSDPLTSSSEQILFNLLQDKATPPPTTTTEYQDQQTGSPSTASFTTTFSSQQLPTSIQPTFKSEQSPSPIQSGVTPPTLTTVSDYGGEGWRSESASISQRDDATGIELNTDVVTNGTKSTVEPQATYSVSKAGGVPDDDDTIEDVESLEDVSKGMDKQTASIQALELRPDSESEQPEPREEQSSIATDSGDKKDEASGMNASGSEEGSHDMQQNFDSIFELLKVDKPPTSVAETNQMSYEEFTDLLSDRSKLQEHEDALTSTEKSIAAVTKSSELVSLQNHSRDRGNLSESKDDNSEIVNVTGNSAPADYLELLRQVPGTSNESTPLISESNQSCEQRKPSESDEWPDIGAPEMMKAFERSGTTDTTMSMETQQQQQQQQQNSSTSVDNNTLPPSLSEDTQLVMPSADVPPMDSGMLQVGDVNLPTLEPAIEAAGEKEALNEEEEEEDVEVEEGAQVTQDSNVKIVQTPESGTKPKKRSKRGGKSKAKKQLTSSVGVTDVLEDQGLADGEPVALATDSVVEKVGSSGTDHTALISQLYQLVCSQQQEIYQLREEQRSSFLALQHQLQGLQVTMTETPRSVLSEYSREQQQRFDKILRDKQQMDKQRQDRLISSLSQTLTTAVNTKLEKLVKNEIKNSVIPAFNRSLGSIQQQLTEVVDHRLNAMDAAVKEGIASVLQSRGLPEQIGGTVAASLQRTLVGNYEEIFKVTVLPSFQKSCQEMFRQIDEAFRKGTAEYVSQFQQHHHQFQEQSLRHLTGSVHSLLAGSQGSPLYSSIQACLNHELTTLMQHTQQVIVEAVSTAIQKEVAAAIEQQASKLNPAPVQQEEKKKKEEEILRFLHFQDYNSAFEVALSTSDLQLVIFVCQKLNPDDIFEQSSCPLSQPVLLSLIQQLSVDLHDRLDLKIKYLEQSILALDMSSEITKSHVISVVSLLKSSLVTIERGFQNNPASNTVMKNVKKLRILAEHTCRSP